MEVLQKQDEIICTPRVTGSYGLLVTAPLSDDYGNSINAASGQTAILAGTTYTGQIGYGGDHDFFQFVAPTSGSFNFRSTTAGGSGIDMYGYLYDASGTLLTQNDDSGGSRQFSMDYTLTAGNTYYIDAKAWSSSVTGSYGLLVTAPSPDDYGNSISAASGQTAITAGTTYTGQIGYGGDHDFFRFVAPTSGSFNFRSTTAGGSGIDMYGYLYDASGTLLTQNDDSGGSRQFSMDYTLTAGNTYYIDAKAWSSSVTGSYGLLVTAPTVTEPAHHLNIQFDYSLDSSGFFNDPVRRDCLEEAASLWSQYITDDFETVAAGTTLSVRNPSSPYGSSTIQRIAAPSAIDDILIYVGATNSSIANPAWGGPTGSYTSGSSFDNRWNSTTNFEPWVGSITFDSTPTYSNGTSASWWFDSTPQTSNDASTTGSGKFDFITVAVHEIGHVLGISGSIAAFDADVSSNYFRGSYAQAANGNRPVPLYDGSHPNGYNNNFTMEVAMAYGGYTYVGHRVTPSAIDLGILADIGYRIDGLNA